MARHSAVVIPSFEQNLPRPRQLLIILADQSLLSSLHPHPLVFRHQLHMAARNPATHLEPYLMGQGVPCDIIEPILEMERQPLARSHPHSSSRMR